jgi:hypothetical protein
MQHSSFIIAISLLNVFNMISCSSAVPTQVKYTVSGNYTHIIFKEKTVAITEPVFLKDINTVKDLKGDYRQNAFVGHIVYDGGLMRSQESYGLIVHSKEIFLKEPPEISKRASSWAKRISSVFIQSHGGKVGMTNLNKPISVTSTEDYTEYDKAGMDNINLPIHHLTYPYSVQAKGMTADFIIVPVIENYYTHTSGWFYGQDIGCGTGGRITIAILIFRGSDGIQEAVIRYSTKHVYTSTYDLRAGEYFQLLSDLENEINSQILFKDNQK